MESRKPFFLTNVLRRKPQNSEVSDENGWGNTTGDPGLNGWGSSPGSTSSAPITNGWADEPPVSHYNGWGLGSGSLPKPPSVETTNNGSGYQKTKDEYNGWGSGSGGKCATAEASTNGWMAVVPLKDGYNGWVNELSEPEPIRKQAEFDVGIGTILEPRQVEVDSWAPSAPPLPDDGFNEDNTDVASEEDGKKGDALCVVCWVARVEGACVPCGHMSSCMTCLHEIESKQGTCPICRSKIDKVIRIYAVQSE
ncbi:E3 ubiquitin-protein ligase XBAT35 [Artemisia annua]|uniref:E3 ubiquitin-protein ligase XBAT35 n=1 Tax=Artemisia annua TaxID=35608 RepID=A0A2U1KNV2_ARTAN|nr:E3 ubiquitin-protein ligase XBAT35 [Artemisia annua]